MAGVNLPVMFFSHLFFQEICFFGEFKVGLKVIQTRYFDCGFLVLICGIEEPYNKIIILFGFLYGTCLYHISRNIHKAAGLFSVSTGEEAQSIRSFADSVCFSLNFSQSLFNRACVKPEPKFSFSLVDSRHKSV